MRFPIADCPGQCGAHANGAFIVGTVDDLAARLAAELPIDSVDGGEVLIVIEVLLLDVQHYSVLGAIEYKGSVAFISFRDEVFPSWIPVSVGPENGDFSADIMRRVQLANPQHVSTHRRSRRLAMHPADDN